MTLGGKKMSFLKNFLNIFSDPSDPKPSTPVKSKKQKLPSPPIMDNPKVKEIVSKYSGYEALQKITIEEGKQRQSIAAIWDASVHNVKPEYQEWADSMCCQVPGHKELHGKKINAIKGNWALEKGLMNEGEGIVDLEEDWFNEDECICRFRFIDHLSELPYSMLSPKGRKEILKFNLTPAQETFCRTYIETGNESAAYLRAFGGGGMEPDRIDRSAKEKLQNGKIKTWIDFIRKNEDGIKYQQTSPRAIIINFIRKSTHQVIERRILEILLPTNELDLVLESLVREKFLEKMGHDYIRGVNWMAESKRHLPLNSALLSEHSWIGGIWLLSSVRVFH
ncbi:MAG: terminase small subunit [Nitrososphaerales archaeon]